METILTDIDDTILKFADGFQDWVGTKGIKTYGRLSEMTSIQDFLRCSRDTVDDLVYEYSVSDHFRVLKPEPCALAVLPTLHKMGFEFVAISSCVNGPVVTEHRIHNIEEVFGFSFKAIHLTGLLKPKIEVLKSYEPSYWVEDNAKNAVDGSNLGHKTFLLNRAYNQNSEVGNSVVRVNDWNAIFDFVVAGR